MKDADEVGDLGTRRSDYLADLDWAGCRNCGHPINITIPVRRFALDILHHLGEAARGPGSRALRDAISNLSADCWSSILSQHYDDIMMRPLIQAAEKARARPRKRSASGPGKRSR